MYSTVRVRLYYTMQRNPSYTIIVEAGCHLHIPMAHAHAHVHGTKDEDWFVAQGWSDTVQPYHIQEREGRKPTKNAQGQTSQKASHTWSQGVHGSSKHSTRDEHKDALPYETSSTGRIGQAKR
eukprot:gb/GECG01005577.1/.p1 GENE.gb/GECG01005577.1/~~gb/GECG01005577.1/.p1  ORF type:complete len:123 (+),score=6.46 gb/GECG01005577.1/:1-369(+)